MHDKGPFKVMDIQQAVKYPFKKENWMDVFVIPLAITFIIIIVMIVPIVIATMLSSSLLGVFLSEGNFDISSFDKSLVLNGAGFFVILACIGLVLFIMLISAPFYGYYWELANTLQTKGLDAKAPQWKGQIKAYFFSGLHLLGINLVLFLPILLMGLLSLGLLLPFVIPPFFLSAKEKSFKSFFRCIGPGIQVAKQQYVTLLILVYLSFAFSFLYSIIGNILGITIVGPFIIQFALYITMIHLFAQQFTSAEGSLKTTDTPSGPAPVQNSNPWKRT